MTFFFPQWQGFEIFHGTETLKAFVNESNIVSVPLSKKAIQKKNNINGYEAILNILL